MVMNSTKTNGPERTAETVSSFGKSRGMMEAGGIIAGCNHVGFLNADQKGLRHCIMPATDMRRVD